MATTQLYFYPPAATISSSTNASVSPTGSPVPGSATLIAGRNPSGVLQAVAVDSSGDLIVGSSALPTGAATSANQTTEIASLAAINSDTSAIKISDASIDSKTPALGQALAAASVPIVLTSAQLSTLTPLSTITANIGTPGALALDATVSAMSAKLPTVLGAHVITASLAVNIASDQVVPTSVASLPLPSGAATETTLSAINTKTPALGQALAAASVPVVLTAAQLTTLTPLTSVGLNAGSNSIGSVNLNAGFNLIGKVIAGIDQTSPGVSNAVALTTPTALTITQSCLSIGTTAQRLTVSGAAPVATRVVLVATPDAASTAKFYIGSATVTATGPTRGIQIVAGQSFIANNDAGDYYIVSDTAAQDVEVMEQQ